MKDPVTVNLLTTDSRRTETEVGIRILLKACISFTLYARGGICKFVYVKDWLSK